MPLLPLRDSHQSPQMRPLHGRSSGIDDGRAAGAGEEVDPAHFPGAAPSAGNTDFTYSAHNSCTLIPVKSFQSAGL